MNPVTSLFLWIEERLDKGAWFRRALAVVAILMTWSLTQWASGFAERALLAKVSLLDTAALITAVAGIPIGLLTVLFNKYVDSRGSAP